MTVKRWAPAAKGRIMRSTTTEGDHGAGLTPAQRNADEARLRDIRQPVRCGKLIIHAEVQVSKEHIASWHSKTAPKNVTALFMLGLERCDRAQIEAALNATRSVTNSGLRSIGFVTVADIKQYAFVNYVDTPSAISAGGALGLSKDGERTGRLKLDNKIITVRWSAL